MPRQNSEQQEALLLAGESSLALTKRGPALALQTSGDPKGRGGIIGAVEDNCEVDSCERMGQPARFHTGSKMTVNSVWAGVLFSVLLYGAAGAQDGPVVISLAVKLNGKTHVAPSAVTLTYGGKTVSIPIRNGRLEVPSDVSGNERVEFSTIVGQEKIRIHEISGEKFKNDEWTLVLEDHRFGAELQPVPKDLEVRSSCVVKFESKNAEGTVLFARHCRSKTSQDRSE